MKLFGHEWTFKKNSNTKNFLEMVVDEQEEMHLYLGWHHQLNGHEFE